MVKKKGSRSIGKIPVRMDSASIEEQTIERVNRTMATLENFLSRWDASRDRPNGMFPEITRIRRFRDALGAWRRVALKAKRKDDDENRIRRLRDFVLICRTYS